MSIRKSYKFTEGPRLRVTVALLLLISIFPSRSVSYVAAQAAQESISPSAGGPKEGIKVHGHWTIEVRNPDGTLVERREFENALVPEGSSVLSNFLARRTSVALWVVQLDSTTTVKPCIVTCGIFEPNAVGTVGPPSHFKNLTVMVNPDSGSLVLAGNVTVSATTTIDVVRTVVGSCPPNVAPSTPCDGLAVVNRVFTIAGPPQLQPVNVVAGQIVQVTVLISFS